MYPELNIIRVIHSKNYEDLFVYHAADKMKNVCHFLAAFLERNELLRTLGVDWRISELVQGILVDFCKHINFHKRQISFPPFE